MTHSTIFQLAGKGLFILLAIVLVTSFVAAQDLILNGNINNNGTINVSRNVVNNTAGSVAVTSSGGTGRVQLTGSGGANTHSVTGGTGISFFRLDARGNRITTLNTATTITDRLRVGYTGNLYTAGTTGFSIGAQTMTIGNNSSYDASSTAVLTLSGGTVVYNSGAAQSVLNNAGGVTYGTLTLSGAGAKSVTTGGTITAASLTQTGGQLTVAENIDVTGTGSIADLGAISAGKLLRLTAAATSGSVTAMNNSGTGTFENASNSSVTIATLSGNAGTINQSGATGTLAFTNDIINAGTITTATGSLDFNGAGTQTNTGGTISVSGAGNAYFAGDIAANPGTLTFASTSTETFDGAAQNLATGVSYGNLVAGGTGAKTATANLTVAGNLTLTNNVLQTGGALTMTSTAPANVSGTGEVRGAVRRNHAFTTANNYMFNRADVYLGTATLPASDITLTMNVATAPTNPATTRYVQRQYVLAPTAAGLLQTIQLHYELAELQGGITEPKIGLRGYNGAAWSTISNAGQTRTSGSNVMTYSGLSNSLAGITELGMYGISFITAANGANISLAAGWEENLLPDNTDDVTIAHTGVVTGVTPVSVASLVINSGSDLTTNNAAGTLTVAGLSTIDGTLNVSTANATLANVTVGSAGVVTAASSRTLTAADYTNNSSATSTFTGDVNFASLALNGNSGAGTMNFNGSASTIPGAVTNAAGTTISVGGTLNMMTSSALSLTSAGNITVNGATGILNIGATGVASNLTMSGTSTLTLNNAGSQLYVFGNLEIGATAILDNSGDITVGE